MLPSCVSRLRSAGPHRPNPAAPVPCPACSRAGGHSVGKPVSALPSDRGTLPVKVPLQGTWNPPFPHHPTARCRCCATPKTSGSPPPDRQPSPAPPVNCPPCSPAVSCLTVQPVRTRACRKTRHRRAMRAASAAAGGNSVRLSRISLQPPFQDGDGGAAQPMQMARRLPPLGPSPRAVPCRGACLTAGMRLEV